MRGNRYLLWNNAICEKFFNQKNKNRYVFLQVDDAVIQEIGAGLGIEEDRAVNDFAIQVVNQISLNSYHGSRFVWFNTVTPTWKLNRAVFSHPPFIGLLALTVLAASRMTTIYGENSTKYYARLEELLGWRVYEDDKRAFDCYWEKLREWLDEDCRGEYGSSTAQMHPVYHHVGYPLSQVVVRQVDIERFADFYRWAKATPEEVEKPLLIWAMFRDWMQKTTCTLDKHFTDFTQSDFFNEQSEAVVLKILQDGYRKWHEQQAALRPVEPNEAEVERPNGRQNGNRVKPLELLMEVDWSEFDFRFVSDSGELPEMGEDGQGVLCGEVEFATNHDTGWLIGYIPYGRFTDIWRGGFEATLGRSRYRFTRSPLLVFGRSEEWSGWISKRNLSFGDRHILLVEEELAGQVQEFLSAYAQKGWYRDQVEPGISAFIEVCIPYQNCPPLADPRLGGLTPELRTSVRLKGGVKLGRNRWLKGYEPTVVIEAPLNFGLAVSVNGEKLLESRDQHIVIDLSQQPRPAGRYTLTVGAKSVDFATDDLTGESAPDLDCLGGYVIAGNAMPYQYGLGRGETGSVVIQGATITGDSRYCLRVPAQFKRAVILGEHPGDVYNFYPQVRPGSEKWAVAIVPFRPQWAIHLGNKGRKYVHLVGRAEVNRERRVGENLAEWKEWTKKKYDNFTGAKSGKPFEHRGLWDEYSRLS